MLLGSKLREAFLAGAYPNATSIQILNTKAAPMRRFDHVEQQCIIENETVRLPFRLFMSKNHTLQEQEFIMRNRAGEMVYVGFMPGSADVIEEGGWHTRSDGVRLPPGDGQEASMKPKRARPAEEYLQGRRRDELPDWAKEALTSFEASQVVRGDGVGFEARIA